MIDNADPEPEAVSSSPLERRVDELERQVAALVETESLRLNAFLESSSSSTMSVPVLTNEAVIPGARPESQRGIHAPAYLSRALLDVERRYAEVELYSRLGQLSDARLAAVAGARVTARALQRFSEDDRFESNMGMLASHAQEHEQTVTATLAPVHPKPQQWLDFYDRELELLQVLDLSPELAHSHLAAAHDAYYGGDPNTPLRMIQEPSVLMDAVATIRDAATMAATGTDGIVMAASYERMRARWRKILVNGLGGIVIVAANAAAATLMGPIGAAVSGAVGSAEVGAAAAAVNG